MIVHVNGRARELPAEATVERVLADLSLDPARRGIAVAVDAEVVPRGEWAHRRLSAGARVEVLSAAQGG